MKISQDYNGKETSAKTLEYAGADEELQWKIDFAGAVSAALHQQNINTVNYISGSG